MNQYIQLLGQCGDKARCPGSTEESLWAALGAGASGLALRISKTKDGEFICAPGQIINNESVSVKTSSLTLQQILELDAGAHWSPKGHENTPWAGAGRNRAIRYISLNRALQIFGRRSNLCVQLEQSIGSVDDIRSLLHRVAKFGLSERIMLSGDLEQCAISRNVDYSGSLLVDLSSYTGITPAIRDKLSNFAFDMIIVDSEKLKDVEQSLGSMSTNFSWAVRGTSLNTEVIEKADLVISTDVLTSADSIHPLSTVFSDRFEGRKIDRSQWTAGYSHANADTDISQDDGIHIEIKEGGEYSGAAAVTTVPVHGDFDAIVDYRVENPHQGTTFEMAAIGIDPGYYYINSERLSGRRVNLTFDVHGAPPYASSECDENDGHRLGWNNGFNLTKIGDVRADGDKIEVDAWSASSVNMYNKYRRDVGKGATIGAEGRLRLHRSGSVFAAYYQDCETSEWVCSGTALVQNLADDVFIRLAAKHWKKKNPHPPKNKVSFYNFKLRQR